MDSGGYSYDQKHEDKNLDEAVDFLVHDEQSWVFLTSMVSRLFARGVYTEELLADCLHTVGYDAMADNVEAVYRHIQKLRWQTRLATGFDPIEVRIPKRFTELTTWKGQIDENFLAALKSEYAKRIIEIAKDEGGEG